MVDVDILPGDWIKSGTLSMIILGARYAIAK